MSRPDSTWKCRCGTLWPACFPKAADGLWGPGPFQCSGGIDPPCAKVLGNTQNACTALPRRRRGAAVRRAGSSARRPSHIPPGQHMEMQMRDTLPRLISQRPQAAFGGPALFNMLGRNGSALRQGFGPCPKHLYGASTPPPLCGGTASRLLSPEARSCPGRTAHGNAGAGHSGPPARRCWTPPGSSPGPALW